MEALHVPMDVFRVIYMDFREPRSFVSQTPSLVHVGEISKVVSSEIFNQISSSYW